MKIAYVTGGDASDVRAWSGTLYFAAKALEAQGISLDYIGPLRMKYEPLLKVREGVHRYVLRHRRPRDHEPFVAKNYALQVMSRLRPEHDLVFGVGTIPISYLDCAKPIVVWTDATFAANLNFYPMLTNVSRKMIRYGNAMEEAALKRCELVIYSSDWAAESAVADYGIDRDRIAVVPFGSNMELELSLEEVRGAVARRSTEKCRLLFIGVEWQRKGGDRAIEIAARLNAAGLQTELDVVGLAPKEGSLPGFVNRLGFIDKASSQGQRDLQRLFMRSHFLLRPARADCSPIVLSEASAHAVPSLVSSVGGIPTLVREGVNGQVFAPDADPAEYCAFVSELFSQPGRYRQLAMSSFEEYRRRLNWRVAGATVRRLLEDTLADTARDR
jgi:glycosyltransferase involved in cell wall biosynthesis